jgi:hypothetical protein
VWSAVGALKVEAVQLIATELTGKATMFGNAIDDEKKRDGEVHQRGLLWKSCDGGWESTQEVGVKRKEWLCTTGKYRESFMQVSDSSRRGGRSMEFSTRVRGLAEGKRDKRVHGH